MKPLKLFAIGAEVVVISTLALSSYNVAFGGASSLHWLAGAPILTVVALEALRIPTALNLVKANLLTFVLSVALIGGLSIITMEAASLAFENLIFERTRPVVEAERDLEKILIGQRTIDKNAAERATEIARLTADLDTARKHREEVGGQKPELQAVAPDRTCSRIVGKGKHAQRIQYSCNSQAQNDTARGNKEAQEAHAKELATATDQVTAASQRLAAVEAIKPDTHEAAETLDAAKRRVADVRAMNPMFRVAAAWQKVPVQELSSEQFEQVKHYAVIALAAATAFSTALVAIISSLPDRGRSNGKLARAIRARLAAKRKTLRRIGGIIRTEYQDRTKVIYVPVDVATGKVLDPAFRPAPASSATPNLKAI